MASSLCSRGGLRSTLVLVALVGCGDDGTAGDAGASASTVGVGETDATAGDTTGGADTTAADTIAAPPMLDAPYGPCAGPTAPSECVDAGPSVAQCLERDGPGGAYSTCALLCDEAADCPAVGGGNITPACVGATAGAPGLCLVDCNTGGANSCATGTVCIDGDPPLCMWPQQPPSLPDVQTFCDVACGVCGATLFLPWSGDCVAECVADLGDCSADEEAIVLACPGGEQCPVGGSVVADCLAPVACVDGTAG